jgi:hypothetical protein
MLRDGQKLAVAGERQKRSYFDCEVVTRVGQGPEKAEDRPSSLLKGG